MRPFFFSTVTAIAFSGGAAVASTVNVGFEGSTSGGIYTESGFTFTSDIGTVALANCPASTDPGCLQMGNNEITTVTYNGGDIFSVNGFSYNGPGDGTLDATGDMVTIGIQEFENGNVLTPFTFLSAFNDITSFSFQNTSNGSGRIDNFSFGVPVAAVPVPAAGLLLLTAVGALASKRRRKTA